MNRKACSTNLLIASYAMASSMASSLPYMGRYIEPESSLNATPTESQDPAIAEERKTNAELKRQRRNAKRLKNAQTR